MQRRARHRQRVRVRQRMQALVGAERGRGGQCRQGQSERQRGSPGHRCRRHYQRRAAQRLHGLRGRVVLPAALGPDC